MYMNSVVDLGRIGFVSTRFHGTDGVSLETEKWTTVLRRMGCQCFFFSGESDWDPEHSCVVPEAYFNHPEILAIQNACFGTTTRDESVTRAIHHLRLMLKNRLRRFVADFGIELLIVENAVSIPMNIPLGLAIAEYISETGIPTIAHHHDFAWERQRFMVNSAEEYLAMAFPPKSNSIAHVVINTEARQQLGYRKGISCTVIPNVFDFASTPPPPDTFGSTFRADMGIGDGDVLLLQPTRVIARKGIEHAIELAGRMSGRSVKLLVSHQQRDEGSSYFRRIVDYASFLRVDLVFATDRIGTTRGKSEAGGKRYSLWDCYMNADFVTYPSTYEGFGNAFLEAVYFRKPIFVNRYSIYQSDIEPAGFRTVLMDSYIEQETVDMVEWILDDADLRESVTEHNFGIGKRHFSYEVLERRLRSVLQGFGFAG